MRRLHMGWLPSGSEPVSLWTPLQEIYTKFRAFVTTAHNIQGRYTNWFDYYFRDCMLLYFAAACL